MDRIFRYIGQLDSAKTAHYSRSAIERDNWWIPDDQTSWSIHMASSAAVTIKQILWGEIISVPRNQYLDSPGWFNIADYLIKSNTQLFSISMNDPNLDLTPEGFLLDCANQFNNCKGHSHFSMSGWPGLVEAERKAVYNNVVSYRNFNHMLDGIHRDSITDEAFQYQKEVLQNVLEYLQKNYHLNKQLIRRSDQPASSVWEKIQDDLKNPLQIADIKTQYGDQFFNDYRKAIKEIIGKAKSNHKYHPKLQNKWLNQRSNLYECVFDFDPNLREFMVMRIDKAYDETISQSISAERLTPSDRADSGISYRIRNQYFDTLDLENSKSGLSEKSILIPEKQEGNRDFLPKLIENINDPEITQKINEIREIRKNPPRTAEELANIEREYIDFLSHHFAIRIVNQSSKSLIIDYMYSGFSFGIKIVANHFIGTILGVAPINSWIVSASEQFIEDNLEKLGTNFRPLKTRIKDKLLSEDNKIMIGRVRNYLSDPVKE